MFSKKNLVFLFLISLILLILQYLPYIYHVRQTPPDRVYLGAERYTPDYYIYLFYTNQGFLNRTTVSDFYTNEPHEDSLVHVEYLIMGKIGSLLGFSVITTYYFFRSLFLIIYIFASFWFITKFIKDSLWQKLTLILSFFWGGLFWPEVTNTGLNLKSYFDFYQPPDLINRLTFEPHKLIGMGLFLIILNVIARTSYYGHRTKQSIKYYILLPLLLVVGFIHGITSISIAFTIIFYLLLVSLLKLLRHKFTLKTLLSFSPFFPIIVFLILPVFYWQRVFATNPVWYNVFYTWEKYFTNIDRLAPLVPTIIGYLFTIGPLIFLSLIGLKKFLNDHKQTGLFILSFLLSNIFLFFLGYIVLGTSKHRFFQTPYLLVWSILASYGLREFADKITISAGDSASVVRGFFSLFSKKTPPAIRALAGPALITTLLLFGLPNLKQGLDRQLYQFGTPPNLEFLAYPAKTFYQGLLWLKKNTTTNDIILSLPTAGNIIPAIPGRKVVVGDYVHTYRFAEKLSLVTKFYKGQMTNIEAKNYLQKEKVSFVFWGEEEKNIGDYPAKTEFLKEVFRNKDVVIYQVKF